uniref:Variant surface glycoprotein 1125.2552 n=1 Tax=Trypanosoma brucei TaxID=5691 RepID=A0A1J0R8C5_9TRYP|nr:variant surface glycoprotein 1125.2552 [Trypanosoma brucei]
MLATSILAILTTVFAPFRAVAEPLDNAAEFRVLCAVYNLHNQKEATPVRKTFKSVEALLTPLENLNISTATDSYYTNADGKFIKPDGTIDTAQLDAWAAQVKKVVETTEGDTRPYVRLRPGPARDGANAQIRHYLKAATQLKDAYEKATQEIQDKDSEAKRKFTEAAFGIGKSEFDKAKWNTERNDLCGGTAGGNTKVGSSVATDLICLCTRAGGTSGHVCGASLQGQVDTGGSKSDQAETAWAPIKTACEAMAKPKKVSAALIHSMLAAFFAQIGRGNSHGTEADEKFTLGQTTSSACAAAAGTMCVNYHQQLGKSGPGIPWVNSLLEAANDLEAASTAATTASELQRALETLQQQARAAYIAGSFHSAAAENMPTSGTETTAKIEECTKHKAKKTCEERNCKWEGENETKGECKPKAVAENTTPGTGGEKAGGAAAETGEQAPATTGCKKHGTNNWACEHDKTSGKQNCAFRKGENNEDDKDT